MTTLNRDAADLMRECHATAATDVTGFGLLGHACEMALGAGVTFQIGLDGLPLMTGVSQLVADGMVPAGCYRNRDHFRPYVDCPDDHEDRLLPLFDPQTSGGLLMSFSPSGAERFMTAAGHRGIFARRIGSVHPFSSNSIKVV
jgi:selenide,water dikinase